MTGKWKASEIRGYVDDVSRLLFKPPTIVPLASPIAIAVFYQSFIGHSRDKLLDWHVYECDGELDPNQTLTLHYSSRLHLRDA